MHKITKRVTRIEIETHDVTVFHGYPKPTLGFCSGCQRNAPGFTQEEIANFFGISQKDVCLQIESGNIHLTRKGNGIALICANSLGDAAGRVEIK